MNKDLRTEVRARLHKAQSNLRSFVLNLEENAHHALSWSDSAFLWAAEVQLAKEIFMLLDAGKSPEMIKEFLSERILRQARNPNNSTSDSARMVARADSQVRSAYLYDVLPFFIKEARNEQV
jgi:hypothetical protein